MVRPILTGFGPNPRNRARSAVDTFTSPNDAPLDRVVAYGHGRRPGPRGEHDPGGGPLPGVAACPGRAVSGVDQQLHLHAARPVRSAAADGPGGTGGVNLDVCVGHGGLPGVAAPRRL